MTVDKPPLALWVQALSVRVFGYHSLSMLVPQALMGMASVALVYDLVRRRFGRIGGFVGGPGARADADHGGDLAPQQPRRAARAVLRRGAVVHGARASRTGRTRWLVLAGVCVGLGFETKMARRAHGRPRDRGRVAVDVARRTLARCTRCGQLLAGGCAMVLVGGAWPVLVELDARALTGRGSRARATTACCR